MDRFRVSGFSSCTPTWQLETLYETTPKWHGLLMIRLPASMAWIKQRTAEYRISNRRIKKGGVAALNLIDKKNRQNAFLRYSTFDIHDSIFAFLKVSISIRLAAVQAGGCARMKLHEIQCHLG